MSVQTPYPGAVRLPVPEPPSDIWPAIQAELRRAVPESTYAIWLAPLRLHDHVGDTLVIVAPDETFRWVADRFERVLQTSVAAVIGPAADVELVRASEAGAAGAAAPVREAPLPGLAPDAVHPKHTFDQFVIGEPNRLAHAAALAVAEQPGQAYNPLFIYGRPGLGKTHLLHSIANYIAAYGSGLTVRCLTVEEFTNSFVAALQAGTMAAFKQRFRRADVLLIDDIQFLGNGTKTHTEEEFFHTFNALYDAGAQLVLTSDRLPRDMDALEDRLRERFESGLITDIQAPDFATRLTILRKRAHHDGIELADPAALDLIADRVTDNIRSLEGALIRVVAYHSLTRRPLDVALAAEVLDKLYPAQRRRGNSVRAIQEATCEAFGVSLDDLLSHSRVARLAWPRQVAMYLARELTDATLPAIAREFGGRNHTTVLHACRRTSARLATDADASAAVAALTARLTDAADDRAT